MLTSRRTLWRSAPRASRWPCPLHRRVARGGGPATVTVRVEGLTETLLPATQVTTTTEPVVKDGKPEDSCSGTSALGALQLATGGNWSGRRGREVQVGTIETIEGESTSRSAANFYWEIWLNHEVGRRGACESGTGNRRGSPASSACYGEARAPVQLPLGIEAPPSANVGEKVSVTVNRYSASGVASAANGRVGRLRRHGSDHGPGRPCHAGIRARRRDDGARQRARIGSHGGDHLRPQRQRRHLRHARLLRLLRLRGLRSVYGRKRGGQLQSSRQSLQRPLRAGGQRHRIDRRPRLPARARTEDPFRHDLLAQRRVLDQPGASPRVQGSLLRL